IDAERWESAILRSADFCRFRPIVVVVEAIDPCFKIENWHEWEPLLLAHDYEFVYEVAVNRSYLREEGDYRKLVFVFRTYIGDALEPAAINVLIRQRDTEHQEKIAALDTFTELLERRDQEVHDYEFRLSEASAVIKPQQIKLSHADTELRRLTELWEKRDQE